MVDAPAPPPNPPTPGCSYELLGPDHVLVVLTGNKTQKNFRRRNTRRRKCRCAACTCFENKQIFSHSCGMEQKKGCIIGKETQINIAAIPLNLVLMFITFRLSRSTYATAVTIKQWLMKQLSITKKANRTLLLCVI